VWVERYREVDARLSKLQETVSELRKRRTKLYQAHIDEKVPTDVFADLKAALDAETTEAECTLDSAWMDEIKSTKCWSSAIGCYATCRLLWKECTLDQQQRLLQVLFPEGTSYDVTGQFRG
jgi:GR25 family glycosyltransferase involved in LPS biosynthesis